MSNLSHVIRKFNRFELKYLVPIRDAERFKEALKANLAPTITATRWAAITCPASITTVQISAFTGKGGRGQVPAQAAHPVLRIERAVNRRHSCLCGDQAAGEPGDPEAAVLLPYARRCGCATSAGFPEPALSPRSARRTTPT